MEFFESLIPVGIVLLCIAGIVALCSSTYFLISMKKTVTQTMAKVDSLIDETQECLDKVKPALDRVDLLMERVTLTVDAANLEIMRVDQILEDVNTITGNVSKATESLDNVASLPLEALSNVTSRIRQAITPLGGAACTAVSFAVNAVDEKLDALQSKVADAQVRADEKRAVRDAAVAQRDMAQDHTNQMSSNLKDAFSTHIASDTDAVINQ